MNANLIAQIKHWVWKYILFDRSYYLTLYQDVRAISWWETWKYSLTHFIHHGVLEQRARRKTPLGLQTVRGLVAVFRAEENFLSGAFVRIRDPKPDRRLKAYVISASWKSVRLVKSVDIAESDVVERNTIQMNWRVEKESKGRLYLIFVASGRRPSRIAVEGGERTEIYSPPVSPLDVPQNICISPVTQCNLNCIHCISRFSRESVRELNDELWAQILAHVESGEIKAISSDYSGDILFASRRRQPWIDRFIETGCPLRLDTHANDLTEDVAEKLLSSNLHSINFSVDTMDPRDYQSIRKGGIEHAEVIDKIRMFMRKRNEKRRDLQVILSFVLMKRNIETMFDAIDLAKELDISFVQGNHLIVMTDDMAEQSLALYPIYYNEMAGRIHEKARDEGVGIVLPFPFRGLAPRSGNAPCRFVWDGAHILGNGDVMACCMPGSKMGNLHEATLKDIWNGKKYQGFRMAVNSDAPPKICRACPIYRYQNNYRSYAWGLSEARQMEFEARCLEASRDLVASGDVELRRGRVAEGLEI